MRDLEERIRQQFRRRADYGKISQCKQKDEETPEDFLDRMRVVFRSNSAIEYNEDPDGVYQQQLKRAFLAGLKPEIRKYIDKHWVHQNTGTLQQGLEYAQHAYKGQQRAKEGTFTLADGLVALHFSGHRGRGGFRGHGQNASP